MISMLAQGEEAAVLLVQLVVWLAFGAICAVIASGRGRSGVGWFFIGLVAGCIGLIILLVLPDLKVQQEREERQRQENRRLRERIAKERIVADSRHSEVNKRLGAHDQALGLDTSSTPQLSGGGAAPAEPPRLPGEVAPAKWYYARDGQRHGPVTAETITHLIAAKAVTGDSLVWRQGMADWLPLRDVPELDGGEA